MLNEVSLYFAPFQSQILMCFDVFLNLVQGRWGKEVYLYVLQEHIVSLYFWTPWWIFLWKFVGMKYKFMVPHVLKAFKPDPPRVGQK